MLWLKLRIMENTNIIYLIGFIGFIITVLTVITFKIFRYLYKFDKIYRYFIRSISDETETKTSFSITRKGLPPINGDCPTKEELDNLE